MADAINVLNDIVPAHRNYCPGIGPYPENLIVDLAKEHIYGNNHEGIFLRPNLNIRNNLQLQNYRNWNGNRAIPDLIIGNKIIEFKLCRPLRNNGGLEKTWMSKIFDPVPNSGSALSDVSRVTLFRQNHDMDHNWELWVIIIGFERHEEAEYSLDRFFPNLFQYISQNCLHECHQQFLSETRVISDRHPFHQTLKLYAFRY